MKANPRDKANLISLLTFFYTLPILKKGFQNELQDDDMYGIVKRCESKLCGKKTDDVWRKSQSMFKLLWKRFGFWYIILFILMVAWTQTHSILQPYGMSRLISYFEKNQTTITRQEAIGCGAIVIFVKFFHFIFWKNVHVWEIYLAVELSTSLKSLLYYKLLRLSKEPLTNIGVGNVVTVMTKDISCIEFYLWTLMDGIVWTIQTVISSYLLWAKIGNSAFVGIGILLGALPIQFYLSTMLTKMRLEIGKNSDQRIQVTQETLSSIKIIKMYTWEDFFIKKIAEARKNEIVKLVRLLFVKFIIYAIGSLTSRITFLILILFYLWMGFNPDTETIFYILNLFQTLSASLSLSIPSNISNAAQIRAAFHRIMIVLKASENEKENNYSEGEPYIKITDATVKFGLQEKLKEISLDLNKPILMAVTGAVGSGKSLFLKLILKDLPLDKGELKINGSISYASQEPWLFPATIKQNILFGEKYEFVRYHQVIQICDLEYDLSLMANGDETLVADRGQNLSKGQQARISLARAVYRRSDIYLLDDCLAPLDGHVQDYIFNECITKFLKEKICVFVSQNPEHIEKANKIITLQEGKVISEKIRSDLVSKVPQKEYITLENNIDDVLVKNHVNNVEDNLNLVDKETKVYQEKKKPGKVDLIVYKKYFRFGGGIPILCLILVLLISTQFCESYSEKLLSVWIDQRPTSTKNLSLNSTLYQDDHRKSDATLNKYTIFVILHSVSSLIRVYVFLQFCRNASINLHNIMSAKVVKAVMAFFDKNYIGNILNRFSLDLNNIDESLPFVFPGFFSLLFSCIGSIILIITVSWHLLLPIVIMLIFLLVIRWSFIPTGRNLKRLEAATRSPLIGHINSSIEGLTTLRAFNAEELMKSEFNKHQDAYNSAVFTQQITFTAFDFYLEVLANTVAALVVVRFLFFEHETSVGDVGLALTQVFNLTYVVETSVKCWAELETNMTSVERILEYTELPQENPDGVTLEKWPTDGSVKFDHVMVNYGNLKELVLKNISFLVKPNHRIGVVGRTGAGKSSIISTLFRLYEFKGTVEIDGTDTKSLALDFLRNNIGIIPQDPVLFTGTVRDNIDPYSNYSDEKIWQAIEQAKIKDIIPSLDTNIKNNGSAFSTGQKQLICLTRVAIGGRRIVVLDEATANLDTHTEDMLYNIVEDIFKDCTILIVAHRLDYIRKCDQVMVIDNGELIEYDSPSKLLQDQHSMFYKMCKESEKNNKQL